MKIAPSTSSITQLFQLQNEPFDRSILEACSAISCKYVIWRICRTFFDPLSKMIEFCKTEAGPMTRSSLPSLIKAHFEIVSITVNAKVELHSILFGDSEDKELIKNVVPILLNFMKHVGEPMAQIIDSKTISEAQKLRRIRGMVEPIENIEREMMPLRALAESRYFGADKLFLLKILAPESKGPIQSQWTVMSIDRASYTKIALTFQSASNARLLFDYNRFISDSISEALSEARVDKKKIHVHSGGDGALVFFENPNDAVKTAIASQYIATRKAKHAPHPAAANQFRIGLATGEVCVERSVLRNGQVLTFEAGGVAIIDAVRIESMTARKEVWACDKTFLHAKQFQEFFGAERKIELAGEDRHLTVRTFDFEKYEARTRKKK